MKKTMSLLMALLLVMPDLKLRQHLEGINRLSQNTAGQSTADGQTAEDAQGVCGGGITAAMGAVTTERSSLLS